MWFDAWRVAVRETRVVVVAEGAVSQDHSRHGLLQAAGIEGFGVLRADDGEDTPCSALNGLGL